MLHSEQKCTRFCSEWGIVGYGKGAVHSGICELGQMGYDQSRLFEDSSEIPT